MESGTYGQEFLFVFVDFTSSTSMSGMLTTHISNNESDLLSPKCPCRLQFARNFGAIVLTTMTSVLYKVVPQTDQQSVEIRVYIHVYI